MAGGSANIILLAVLSAVAANTCTLNPITWSCSDPPHLTLKFSEKIVNRCNETHSKDLFQVLVSISYSRDIDQETTYTAVMVDPDAPGHTNGQAWLHWIRAGLTAKDVVAGTMHTGHDTMAYAPPTPPKGTGFHRYFVFLFEETKHGRAEDFKNKRSKFDLEEYAMTHQLCGPLASNMFQTNY